MSRRTRAVAFLVAALVAAIGAGAVARGYGQRIAGGYGRLRPVVVAADVVPAGRPIDAEAAAGLELRRVPLRFVPPGALSTPAEAVGLVPRAPIPGGSYVLAGQLRPPGGGHRSRLGGGRRPVEIAVSGAGALAAAGTGAGSAVDVVVTSEPRGSGAGRTFVAAAAVPLLGIGPEGSPAGGEGTVLATLGLTRPQALRLIAAESFARRVTVIPRP